MKIEKRPFFYLSRDELALVAITMAWGVTFLTVRNALNVTGPFFFVGFRFAVATVFMAFLSIPVLRGLNLREVLMGGAIGVCIYMSYSLQAHGMLTISSSKSAFITAFYVPIVPLLQWIILRRPPHFMSWLGIFCAFAGLLLLAGPEGSTLGLGWGEFLTLLGALVVSVEIILIGKFARNVNARRVTIVQLGVTSILAFASVPVAGELIPVFSWTLVLSAVGLGSLTAVIQLIMNWAQKRVSPTRATVIYAAEPVWAGLFGRIAGERLPPAALLGGALIVLGVLISELRFKRMKPPLH